MSETQATTARAPRWVGVSAAVMGVIGLAGFAWTWILSATPVDPPEWLRIAGVWLMPVGILWALIAGLVGLKGPGRPWAVAGVVLSVVAIGAFVALISLWDS